MERPEVPRASAELGGRFQRDQVCGTVEHQAGSVRERIQDAALASCREGGIGATSVLVVARQAGIPAATIPNHFGVPAGNG